MSGNPLSGLLMHRMFFFKTAVFFNLHAIRSKPLILSSRIIPPLALGTSESDQFPRHLKPSLSARAANRPATIVRPQPDD